ncbi:MAG: hypothetical protein JXB15_10125 [Anaerolineales bacterium]|nr:hypothetical protein [Anaerolineales bacterium]
MDNPGDKYSSVGKRFRRFGAGLLILRSLISRLVSLVSVTQQDLIDAGVYHHWTRD